MGARQLSFLPAPETEHGGSFRKGKRKLQRPFDRKRPLHVTLRSRHARGTRSLLTRANKWRVHHLLEKSANRYRIRVFRFANVGNHLHLLIQAHSRREFQGFLRELAGSIASMATGAIKGRPEKFWDGLAWSRIVDWGRHFRRVARYVVLNVLEASGTRSNALLSRLEREGIVVMRQERGS